MQFSFYSNWLYSASAFWFMFDQHSSTWFKYDHVSAIFVVFDTYNPKVFVGTLHRKDVSHPDTCCFHRTDTRINCRAFSACFNINLRHAQQSSLLTCQRPNWLSFQLRLAIHCLSAVSATTQLILIIYDYAEKSLTYVLGPYFRTSIRYNFQRLSTIGTTIYNDNRIAGTELKQFSYLR